MRQLKITQVITSRDSHSLEKYLQEISKIKLLSPDEEVGICILIREGNKMAAHRLINANLRFVVSVAKRYQHQGLSLSDLINEGNIGLINAIDRFDSSRGFKFISYAVWWIRQSIIMALAENSRIVRLPLNRVSLNKRIADTRATLEQDMQREPSAEELADVLKMNVADIAKNMTYDSRHLSLDSPQSEGADGTLLDTLESPDGNLVSKDLFHTQSLRVEVARSMKHLTFRQKEILCCFFGIGRGTLSLGEIGERFNLSGERIRQIKDRAISSIRSKGNKSLLRSYL